MRIHVALWLTIIVNIFTIEMMHWYRSQEDREARQKLRKAGQLAAAAPPPVVVPEPAPPQDDFQGTYVCV